MVKGVGHGGGAMGWRGGGDRRQQPEVSMKKKKKLKKVAGAGYTLVKRLRFTALIFFFFFLMMCQNLSRNMICHLSNWILNGELLTEFNGRCNLKNKKS